MADTAGFRQMEITAENPVTHSLHKNSHKCISLVLPKCKSFMALPNKAYLEYYLTHDK